ncbi:Glycine cleavage system protein P (pyridoxal-binding) N-terminal domain [Rubrobacter radiotolerans]|uniref:Probable glycine dehydrogenase (decarboxylating) subunit 1 n=1 Tax=Rubrobacter radiotolerans TaxID=42256 RepID=A0A023X753_RUBRA|nr:aminomethyl-transferring glycine dehydrogenase subunit GcvPA [Rubrobacter radiotolerans]AHY48026.1 Glycine cleavage system protein P (pyridoxal-binding) N-terminal domain [Rubrobacter radiotolerans]MDX5892665.1 aminomethyl-transferring glycine dehydrogenase subunit GcvPA [Rubrobacter radiotolerans]SMC08064.1 glycine dehydrogenase (decarboxylating) alpha subunit [Rubrobacter radiotolerans DSM 5868]
MARFTPHTEDDVREMLGAIGLDSVDDLFSDVPTKLEKDLDLPPALSEYEALRDVETLARKNSSEMPMFLGAGAYDRIVPSAIGAMLSRGEYLTAYTPYQPEISQGGLQVIFEFQSMISELTGLEVANASVYDGANAVVEAALMTARLTKRDPKVATSKALNPRYREVMETYGVEVVDLNCDNGTTDFSDVPDDVSGVFVQSPSFFGTVEDIGAAAEAAHAVGALCVAVCDPVSLAVLEAPGNLGVDVAVGEAQPLGMNLSFGGPYAGYMATREKYVRQLPGRIAGETVDADGKLAYVLTLRGREQDIRRARANSNICTNQALTALAATVYTALLGPEGLREVAHLSASKAHYLAVRLAEAGLPLRYPDAPFLWEFVVEMEDVAKANEALLEAGIVGGYDLGDGGMLVAVTEKRTRSEMDAFVEAVREVTNA